MERESEREREREMDRERERQRKKMGHGEKWREGIGPKPNHKIPLFGSGIKDFEEKNYLGLT